MTASSPAALRPTGRPPHQTAYGQSRGRGAWKIKRQIDASDHAGVHVQHKLQPRAADTGRVTSSTSMMSALVWSICTRCRSRSVRSPILAYRI